ncbi:MAG: Ig-like domain-containing protein [Candidatus Zixiibacteriota bacterium]
MIRNFKVFGPSRQVLKNSALFLVFLMIAGFAFGQEVDPANTDIGAESYAAETGDSIVIFCILRDDLGTPIAGRDVVFHSDRPEDIIVDDVVTSDSTGYAQTLITTDVEGESIISAESGPIGFGPADSAILWTEPPPPDPVIGPDECEIGADTYSATVGDLVTIYAIVRDTEGAPMEDVSVAFTSDRDEDIIDTSPVTTDADGRAEATLSTTIEGLSNISIAADTFTLGAIDPISWAMPIVTRYLANYWNASGDSACMFNVTISNGSSSMDYISVSDLDLELDEHTEYAISYMPDSLTTITNRHKLHIEHGTTRQLDYYGLNPMDMMPREMAYTFFKGHDCEMDLVSEYDEGTLHIEGGVDRDAAFVIDQDLTEGFNYAITDIVCGAPDMIHEYISWGTYYDGIHQGIWADVQMKDLEFFDVTFSAIPTFANPVGIKNAFVEEFRPFDFGFNFPCQLKEATGEVHESAYIFPQHAVREGYYRLETMMDVDGYADIALPIHVSEENPVILDLYPVNHSALVPYHAMKIAEPFQNVGVVTEQVHDEEDMYISIDVISAHDLDWWFVVVLPNEYTVESMIGTDAMDIAVELYDFNDYAITELETHRVVAIRVEPGMENIQIDYRSASAREWDMNIGWNMVSYPFTDRPAADEIFTLSPFDPFVYDSDEGMYVEAENLEPGKGYFVYYRDEEVLEPELSMGIDEFTIVLEPGWNLIGGPDAFFPARYITMHPEVISPIYAFNTETGIYYEPTTIEFGKAYWVLVTERLEIELPY